MILDIDNILVSSDILTEYFACDLAKCKGRCCIEGDAGAPVTLDEIAEIEDNLDKVWPHLSASAQSVIDQQGVAYNDPEGELVTSIVNGKDCVFTCYDDIKIGDKSENSDNSEYSEYSEFSEDSDSSDKTVKNCCLCAYERLFRQGKTGWCKPMSCALYPIRVKTLSNNITAINYHRWEICRDAVEKGRREGIKVYQFLREPLIRRFGKEWYDQLEIAAAEMQKMQ